MASETATIRVARETRDRLAAQARTRGVSLATMLAEYARDVDRRVAVESERRATLADAENADAQREERDWETALGDGLA